MLGVFIWKGPLCAAWHSSLGQVHRPHDLSWSPQEARGHFASSHNLGIDFLTVVEAQIAKEPSLV